MVGHGLFFVLLIDFWVVFSVSLLRIVLLVELLRVLLYYENWSQIQETINTEKKRGVEILFRSVRDENLGNWKKVVTFPLNNI